MSDTQLDLDRIPRHVAIIMDGNGRWAKERGLERTAGHRQGVEAVKRITREAARLGVSYLTLYAFSTENWHRPTDEVSALMGLILTSLEDEIFMANNVRFRVIGDRSRLPADVSGKLAECEAHTAQNSRMTMVVALSYSSRWEIVEAARALARQAAEGKLRPDAISEQTFAAQLATSFMPDPELLIRTGGELRLSNYLLWQSAYTELYFCNTYWPDFDENAFRAAIADFQHRHRRFGMTDDQIKNTTSLNDK